MSMHAQSILLNILEKVYYSHKHTLQDYINEYYSESAQLINLGFYEMKRRPKKATVTSKVHRDEHHSELSHTQLKDARRTRKPETAASELTETSLRGSRILLSTPPNHLADSETRPLSHSSLTMAQRNVERSSSEPHAITPEERKPSVEAITHREQKSRTAPSNQSDRNRTIAQMSKNLDSLESRFNSHKNLSQRTSTRATNVETDPPSHCVLTQVQAENGDPKLDHRSLTPDDSKSSHRTETESMKTHMIKRARGDTASTLSRVQLSKNPEVVLRPRKDESENVSPTPSGRINDDRLSSQVWKPPDERTSRLQRPYAVNSSVDIMSVETHSLKDNSESKKHSLTPRNCISDDRMDPRMRKLPDKDIGSFQRSCVTNNSVDSTSVRRHSLSKERAQIVPTQLTRSSLEFLEFPWGALNKSRTQHERKPPDKEINRLQGPYTVNSNVDSSSKVKCSPLKPEAHTVPPRPTRSLKELLKIHKELEWRAHSKTKPYKQRTRKAPDKLVGKGFHSEALKLVKTSMQRLSNMQLPAFDSVLRRQARTVPRPEPNE
ncbi:hypothetical protein JOM56_012944 [Amanita muscaria]